MNGDALGNKASSAPVRESWWRTQLAALKSAMTKQIVSFLVAVSISAFSAGALAIWAFVKEGRSGAQGLRGEQGAQ